MARWWELKFLGGPPTDADWEHVAEQMKAGMTSGQLFNEADYAGWVIRQDHPSGFTVILHDGEVFSYGSLTVRWDPGWHVTGVWVDHAQVIGQVAVTASGGEFCARELTGDDYAGLNGTEPGSG